MSQAAARVAPPRFPRALFIAAFAVASAATFKLKRPAATARTEARLSRRDRSVGHITKQLGRAIVAAGEAQDAFAARGVLYFKPEPPAPKIDAIARLIIDNPAVAGEIGRCAAEPNDETPWVEVHRDAATPHVKIYWRGEFIQGERMGRILKHDQQSGRQWVEQGQGETVGSSRRLDMDRFTAAVEAARQALRKGGVLISSFCEAKRVNTPVFKGAIATIGLMRERPKWMAQQPAKRAGFSR